VSTALISADNDYAVSGQRGEKIIFLRT